MGGVKAAWLDAQKRGYDIDDGIRVCLDCFEDDALKDFISSNGSEQPCSFCEETESSSCPLFDVVGVILEGISMEWGHPADEGLPYETREGGWQGTVYDTWEMLESAGLETSTHKLFQTIAESVFYDEWCKRDPYSLEKHQTLLIGWNSFSQFVISEARYVFLQVTPSTYDEHQHDEIHPVAILDHLGSMANDLKLITMLKAGSEVLRIRIVDPDVTLTNASELGAPPSECATFPNRMSPAGIPMFYGAFDAETAIAETYDLGYQKPKKGFIGKFRAQRDLLLLDLSQQIELPSIFDLSRVRTRHLVRFIKQFGADFSKPVARNDRSHIDYVPTQVVTEYFRHIFRAEDDRQLDGIIYPSSKHVGSRAIVLFVKNEQCVDHSEEVQSGGILSLTSVEEVLFAKQI
ncbi:HEPN-associated N-terminal domain-containing protein [Nitrosomonas supralitoralis]|uniref:RES domain-containing protein n=1 Tax=Nitrosomonas supralitoralis TaxID=2116706 RepID=A0A2P7NRM1_9PROT|nr:HEPN-associated N-terminal domain-containing protein [Nitrosomonas supralitoralis]PSJ16079.1 RES domain-containing protein [Nitrosomonas supralitoralis]